MARNRALQILEDGDFSNMSSEDFVHWLRALEHAPVDHPEEPTDNDQHDTIRMDVLDELRSEALARESAILKRIRFLEENMCDDTAVKRGAIYKGRPGTMFYLDDGFNPTNEAAATRARMLFDDGTWKSLVLRERKNNNVLLLPRR